MSEQMPHDPGVAVMGEGWIATFTSVIDVFNPTPEQINIADIVAGLPHINRFGGQTIWPYSVSTHSCMIYEYGRQALNITEPWELAWALLHDAVEAYIGDVPRPIKRSIPAFSQIEERILKALATKLELPPELPGWVKYADKHIVRREAFELFPSPPRWAEEYDDIGTETPRWDVDESRAQFVFRLKKTLGDDILSR